MNPVCTDSRIKHFRDGRGHGTDRPLKAREHRQCGESHRGLDLLRLPSIDRERSSTYQSGHGNPSERQKRCPNVDIPLRLQFLLTCSQNALLPLPFCRREFDLPDTMQSLRDNMCLVIPGGHYSQLFPRVVFARDAVQWL